MKKLIAGISATVFYLSMVPSIYATTDLCNPDNAQGVKVNQLCELGKDPGQLVGKVVGIALFIAFVAALLYLIYGGIRWIMSGGDKEATGKAKGTVTAALIGLAIVLASWILINFVLTLFGGGSLNALTLPSLI